MRSSYSSLANALVARRRSTEESSSRWGLPSNPSPTVLIACFRSLNDWAKRLEIATEAHAGITATDLPCLKNLKRQNKELRQTYLTQKLVSAFFAQAERDRRLMS